MFFKPWLKENIHMRLSAICICLVLSVGCRSNEQNQSENGNHYVLIGERSKPPYAEVQIGHTVGSDHFLMVFSNDSVKSDILLKLDGKEHGSFDGKGGLVMPINRGHFEVTGEAKNEMYLYLIESNDNLRSGVVIDKSILPAGKPLSYSKHIE